MRRACEIAARHRNRRSCHAGDPEHYRGGVSISGGCIRAGLLLRSGIAQVRKRVDRPVYGIAESAYLAAHALGERFGIISLGQSSIDRHLRYLKALRLDQRLAGDRSIDRTVSQLMAGNVVDIVSQTARLLRDEDGADVVILGCAGLGGYRDALQQSLGIPVIDPVQAGATLALTHLDLAYGRTRR